MGVGFGPLPVSPVYFFAFILVARDGLEPPTPAFSGPRSTN